MRRRPEEIDQLEAAAQTDRDRLIVRLLADTGIRVGELCGLGVNDMTRHERGALLKVRGKGDKERFVPLRPEYDAMMRMLAPERGP